MQELCPEPGCVSRLSAGTSDWAPIDSLLWCPLHKFGEQRRLQGQADEYAWYELNIMTRETSLHQAKTDPSSPRSLARALGLAMHDPRVQRAATEKAVRIAALTTEIATLKHNRDAALTRHDAANEQRRQILQLPDENSD